MENTIGFGENPMRPSGPIDVKDVPIRTTHLNDYFAQDEVKAFLNSGEPTRPKDLVAIAGGHEPQQAWLHQDGTFSRGNNNHIDYPSPWEVDLWGGMQSEGRDAAFYAGSVAVIVDKGNVRVSYDDTMTAEQKASLSELEQAAGAASDIKLSVQHIESPWMKSERLEIERQNAKEDRKQRTEQNRTHVGPEGKSNIDRINARFDALLSSMSAASGRETTADRGTQKLARSRSRDDGLEM